MSMGIDNILSIACANLKAFGLSPKCSAKSRALQRKRATLLIFLLIVLHLSSLYVELRWCAKTYPFASMVMNVFRNFISFVLSLSDYLLPILMEEELEMFLIISICVKASEMLVIVAEGDTLRFLLS